MEDSQLKALAASNLLLEGLQLDENDCILPTKLGSHLCTEVFDFYSWLRSQRLMERGTGVKGGTPHYPSKAALDAGWMVEVRRTGTDRMQPLFTGAGCAEVAQRFLVNPPASMARVKRVASILMLLNTDIELPTTASTVVYDLPIPVGTCLKIHKVEQICTIFDKDEEEGSYIVRNTVYGEFTVKPEEIEKIL